MRRGPVREKAFEREARVDPETHALATAAQDARERHRFAGTPARFDDDADVVAGQCAMQRPHGARGALEPARELVAFGGGECGIPGDVEWATRAGQALGRARHGVGEEQHAQHAADARRPAEPRGCSL